MIYWVCFKCKEIEETSNAVLDLRHQHFEEDGNRSFYLLQAVKLLVEAKGLLRGKKKKTTSR